MTTIPTHCLECNAPLSPAETQGLCARCLLKMGLASQFGESSVADAGARRFVPPPMFPFDFGGYRVLRLLGRGGMGAVYEAEQRDPGRRVALKVLGHTIDSAEMRARFMREGRLAASVNHPNSVYIFGTEEIEGAPVIAMELVAGGTLRDRLRKGPLPVREAVDATLDVIAGLEAAASAGVLHRDVKPANCFVAPDGTVKVGDFGLSVSTLARHDTQLTASGVMLGTPSFAPPEQLRGDELDVRADIYSVGATLYSLLTGKAPFEGDNAVQVVAAVLDKPAPFISGIPAALAQIVARSLAKKRDDRFATYGALRDALLPFSSAVPEPAPLGLRFLAGVVDEAVATLPALVALVVVGVEFADAWLAQRTPQALLAYLGAIAAYMLYYALFEGLTGGALGKRLCRMRVAGADGSAPGFRRALGRVSFTAFALNSGTLLASLLTAKGEFVPGEAHWADWAFIPGWWALFVTMRRANGFAAIHDLATGTRVVVRQKSAARVQFAAPKEAAPADDAAQLGPYLLAGEGIGYDPALRRRVWVRKTAAPGEERRDLARPGRLRWLGEVEGVQVFESPGGCALRDVLGHSQPWVNVRKWLADLANELDAAGKDGTLPSACGLASVWIAASGRAVLLDEPPAGDESPAFDVSTPTGAQQFLDAVAAHALDRRAVPLHAREFLEKLASGAFDRLSFIAGNLQSLLTRPAEVSRGRRAASIFSAPACWLVLAIFMVFITSAFVRNVAKIERQHPGFTEVPAAIIVYDALLAEMELEKSNRPRAARDPWRQPPNLGARVEAAVRGSAAAAAARWISYRGAALIRDRRFDEITRDVLDDSERALARRAVQEYPSVTPEEFSAGASLVREMIAETRKYHHSVPHFIGPSVFVGGLITMALIHCASVLLFATGPGLRMFGLAVVDCTGRPAGRLRLLVRGVIAWLPLPLTALACFAILRLESTDTTRALLVASLILGSLTLLAGALWSALSPAAGPHDLATGTRVVPR
jgi:hypothetical protein